MEPALHHCPAYNNLLDAARSKVDMLSYLWLLDILQVLEHKVHQALQQYWHDRNRMHFQIAYEEALAELPAPDWVRDKGFLIDGLAELTRRFMAWLQI